MLFHPEASPVSKLFPVIRRLYDAATDGTKWQPFLKELADCLGADGAHMVRVQPQDHVLSFSVLYGYDEAMLRMYGNGSRDLKAALARFEEHFEKLMPSDPRVRLIEQYPSRPLSCRLALTDEEIRNSRVYRELLQHGNVEYSLVVSVPEDDGSLILLGVFRGRESTFFKEEEAALFGELIPYVKQAVALSEHLARADFSKRLALEALDALTIGIFITDEDARVLHANAAAKRLADLGDGLTMQGNTLKLHAKETDTAMHEALRGVTAQTQQGNIPRGEAISATRPSGKEPLPLVVGALWGDRLRYGVGRLDRPVAMVFVTDPEQSQEAPAELLRRLFGLTLKEAAVCERIVRGETSEEIGEALGISTDTVRVHLKSVFGKVGVSRQAELVSRILASPVWVRYHEESPPALTRREGGS
jgi:DNA-binding CsgD family transcriptional regulator/GAF domain-containing protein